MRSKLDDLYDQACRRDAPAVATPASGEAPRPVSASERRAPYETFEKLEARIRETLGVKVKGIVPLLNQARGQVVALFPPGGPSQVHGPERAERHTALDALLDQIEDVYQALQLASRTR